MPSIQALTRIVPTALLASVLVCGCASVSPGRASAVKAPAARAAPVTDTATVAATAGRVSASATASTPATAAADSKAQNADAKVTCHMEALTGSRVAIRVCETAAQRKARQAAARDTQDQLARPAPGCPRLGPGGCAGGG